MGAIINSINQLLNRTGKNTKIPVLLYHNFVTDSSTVPSYNLDYTCTPSQFEENMTTLLNNGYHVISFLQLYNAVKKRDKLPAKPMIITLDDGLIGQYNYAFPIIKKLNIHAGAFIVPDWLGKTTDDGTYFTWPQANEMKKSGYIDILSHSMKHMHYLGVPINQFVSDTAESFSIINQKIGAYPIEVYAYPYGNYNIQMVQALKKSGVSIQVMDLGVDTFEKINLSNVRRLNIPINYTGEQIMQEINNE
ncbi:MAG: polysaccharide deacetylase family protein [Bacillota bacterium]|nr:polysaccharide deacetylase family protein [Bacillota bacterium]